MVLAALPTIEAHLSKTLVLTGRHIDARRSYRVLRAGLREPHHRKHLRRAMMTARIDADGH